MSGIFSFTPRFLTAPEYVFALHEPSDQVAVLVRNRTRHQTTQRILSAETIASAPFQSWLQRAERVWSRHFHRNESSKRRIAKPDQRTNPRSTPRLSRPRRGSRRLASGDPYFRRRAAAEFRSRHFARKTSGRLACRGPRHEPGGNAVACPGFAVRRRPGSHGYFPAPSFAWIHE